MKGNYIAINLCKHEFLHNTLNKIYYKKSIRLYNKDKIGDYLNIRGYFVSAIFVKNGINFLF